MSTPKSPTHFVRRSALLKKVRSEGMRLTTAAYNTVEKDVKDILAKEKVSELNYAYIKSPYFSQAKIKHQMKKTTDKNIKASVVGSAVTVLTDHIDQCTDTAIEIARHRNSRQLRAEDYVLAFKTGCGRHKNE